MKIKFLSVALGVVLSATIITAQAQKAYTKGAVTVKTNFGGQEVEVKQYFTPDSTSGSFAVGPAKIGILADAKNKFFAVLVDVSVASIKKAAVYTPDEIDQSTAELPTFTFAPGTETKQVSGFNCKKVVATDNKTKATYDIWVTNDITVPTNVIPYYYRSIGGFPVQYPAFQRGNKADATVTSVTDEKAPAGTFIIPADFEKISKDDLEAMSGGR